MISLNYHHLYYFWTTAKAGRIGEAARALYLAQPTLSLQIQELERSLGVRLLERGRLGVALTPEGRVAFDYCERIFSQGDELLSALRPGAGASSPVLRLGVAGAVSRHAAQRLFERARGAGVRARVVSGANDALKSALVRHELDLVVADTDLSADLGVEFRGRLCGQLPVNFVAAPAVAASLRRFPAGLQGAAMLLPSSSDPVRKEVDLYLHRRRLRVVVAAEVEGAEILRVLTTRGGGVAALDALTTRDDLARGALKKLNPRASGIKQQIWLAAGRHPKPNPILRAVIEGLWTGFRIGA